MQIIHKRAVSCCFVLALFGLFAPAYAAGPPEAIEVRVETGTSDGQLKFIPNEFSFERGKYYKLLIHNPSQKDHYFTAETFASRVFTRKVEVIGADGQHTVEIHGDIHDMELTPGVTVAWYFYPMTNGKDLPLYCHKEGHEEAGMVGKMTISGPPPFSGN
jgi:uncharacterized cupredoxin-like copper-binding protein